MNGRARLEFFILICFISFSLAYLPTLGQANGKQEKELSKSDTLIKSRYTKINKIHIIGNKKTQRNIITRELDFTEGENIPSTDLNDILERSRNNVYNTNLFSTVEFQKLQLDSSTIDIMIQLEERWYVYPSVVFRLIDRNFSDWWVNRDRDISRTKYGIKLDIYNVRGRKEKLKLIGLSGFEKNLLFTYSIPYIEKSQKHGLSFGGSYVSNKKLAYKTQDHLTIFTDTSFNLNQSREAWSASILYSYRPSFYNYHYVSINTFGVTIDDTIAAVNPNYFGNGATSQNAIKISYLFRRDTRDNRNYPLSGYFFLTELEKVGIGIFNDVDIWRSTTNYFQYYDLGKGFYASISLGAQLTSSKGVPYYNYTQFGYGTYYVRGYELDVIEGPHNILTKNSLRKKLFAFNTNLGKAMPIKKFRKVPFAFYAKLFSDFGYVNNYKNYEQNKNLTNKLLYGVGLGLDFVTLYDLTFRAEYSYNSEGKFHFFPNFRAELSF